MVLCLAFSAPPSLGVAAGEPPLSPQEKQQVAALAAKVLSVIKGMPSRSSQTTFEGVILGVTSGKPCRVVKAAVVIVVGTAHVPKPAVAAAKDVASSCGPIGAVNRGNDLVAGPGFGGGGGGPGYTP